jgi:CBS domain-containing protein
VAGVIGWIEPRTLGVGYDNIDALVQGHFGVALLFTFGTLKFVSWVISLGSGTSGGTLAPLFMIGGSLGALLGSGVNELLPWFHVDIRIAALVGMAAIFSGSSRAFLTAIVFSFETTRQAACLLPLLGGCTAAYLISALLMRNTIMTEKIARRGVRVPSEYAADYLDQIPVGKVCSRGVYSLRANQTLEEVRHWLNEGSPQSQHYGFPVMDEVGQVKGLVTLRALLNPKSQGTLTIGELVTHPPVMVNEDHSLRAAADLMAAQGVGRLMVITQSVPHKLIGMLTRGDIIAAHGKRLREARRSRRSIRFIKPRKSDRRV